MTDATTRSGNDGRSQLSDFLKILANGQAGGDFSPAEHRAFATGLVNKMAEYTGFAASKVPPSVYDIPITEWKEIVSSTFMNWRGAAPNLSNKYITNILKDDDVILRLFPPRTRDEARRRWPRLKIIGDTAEYDRWIYKARVLDDKAKRSPPRLNQSSQFQTRRSMRHTGDGFQMAMDFALDDDKRSHCDNMLDLMGENTHLTFIFRELETLTQEAILAITSRICTGLPMNSQDLNTMLLKTMDQKYGMQKDNYQFDGIVTQAISNGNERATEFQDVFIPNKSQRYLDLREENRTFSTVGPAMYANNTPNLPLRTRFGGIRVHTNRPYPVSTSKTPVNCMEFRNTDSFFYLMTHNHARGKADFRHYRRNRMAIRMVDGYLEHFVEIDPWAAFEYSGIFSPHSNQRLLHGHRFLMRMANPFLGQNGPSPVSDRGVGTTPSFPMAPTGDDEEDEDYSQHFDSQIQGGADGGPTDSNGRTKHYPGRYDPSGRSGAAPRFGLGPDNDPQYARADTTHPCDLLPNYVNAYNAAKRAGADILRATVDVMRRMHPSTYQNLIDLVKQQERTNNGSGPAAAAAAAAALSATYGSGVQRRGPRGTFGIQHMIERAVADVSKGTSGGGAGGAATYGTGTSGRGAAGPRASTAGNARARGGDAAADNTAHGIITGGDRDLAGKNIVVLGSPIERATLPFAAGANPSDAYVLCPKGIPPRADLRVSDDYHGVDGLLQRVIDAVDAVGDHGPLFTAEHEQALRAVLVQQDQDTPGWFSTIFGTASDGGTHTQSLNDQTVRVTLNVIYRDVVGLHNALRSSAVGNQAAIDRATEAFNTRILQWFSLFNRAAQQPQQGQPAPIISPELRNLRAQMTRLYQTAAGEALRLVNTIALQLPTHDMARGGRSAVWCDTVKQFNDALADALRHPQAGRRVNSSNNTQWGGEPRYAPILQLLGADDSNVPAATLTDPDTELPRIAAVASAFFSDITYRRRDRLVLSFFIQLWLNPALANDDHEDVRAALEELQGYSTADPHGFIHNVLKNEGRFIVGEREKQLEEHERESRMAAKKRQREYQVGDQSSSDSDDEDGGRGGRSGGSRKRMRAQTTFDFADGHNGAADGNTKREDDRFYYRTAAEVKALLYKIRLTKQWFRLQSELHIPMAGSIMLAQPYIQTMNGGCLFMNTLVHDQPMKDTAAVIVEDAAVLISSDTNGFVTYFHSRFSSGVFVINDQNLEWVSNTYISKYYQGGGVTFYDWTKDADTFKQRNHFPKDMFCFFLHGNWRGPDEPYQDLKGYRHPRLYSGDKLHTLMWPNADIYNELWEFGSHVDIPHMYDFMYQVYKQPTRFATMMMEGSYRVWHPESADGSMGGLTEIIESKGPYGRDVVPSTYRVLKGALEYMRSGTAFEALNGVRRSAGLGGYLGGSGRGNA